MAAFAGRIEATIKTATANNLKGKGCFMLRGNQPLHIPKRAFEEQLTPSQAMTAKAMNIEWWQDRDSYLSDINQTTVMHKWILASDRAGRVERREITEVFFISH